MGDAPPTAYASNAVRPHRGGIILALGIIGIVLCVICGIIAWVMANNDLRDMAAGRMDPTGEGLTKAGKICGIIGVVLQGLGLLMWVLLMVLGVGAMWATGAAAGG